MAQQQKAVRTMRRFTWILSLFSLTASVALAEDPQILRFEATPQTVVVGSPFTLTIEQTSKSGELSWTSEGKLLQTERTKSGEAKTRELRSPIDVKGQTASLTLTSLSTGAIPFRYTLRDGRTMILRHLTVIVTPLPTLPE